MPRRIHSVPTSGIGQLTGIQQIVKVPQPAAGAEWTDTLPGGYFYRVLGGSAVYTTSAAVASRLLGTQLSDGASNVVSLWNATAMTAGLAVQVGYTPSGGAGGGNIQGPVVTLVLPAVWLPQNYIIRSTTLNKDVADQYSSVVIWLECLDFGALGVPEMRHPSTPADRMITGEPAPFDPSYTPYQGDN